MTRACIEVGIDCNMISRTEAREYYDLLLERLGKRLGKRIVYDDCCDHGHGFIVLEDETIHMIVYTCDHGKLCLEVIGG